MPPPFSRTEPIKAGGDLTVIAQATSGNGGQNVSGQFSGVKWGTGGEATSQASGASSDGKNVTVEAIASVGGSSGEGIVSTC
jgi:hypothetical protein